VIGTLLRRNLSQQSVLLAAVGAGMVGLEVLLVHVASGFAEGPGLSEIMSYLPGFMRELVSSRLAEEGFSALVAFGLQHPLGLVGVLAHGLVGGTVPAADRDRGTLDLFLARPVSRAAVLTASLVPVLVGAVVLTACTLLGIAIGLATVEASGEEPWTAYLPAAGQLLALLAASGCGALLASTLAHRRGTAVAWCVGLLVVCFVHEVLDDLWAPLQPFSFLNPMTTFAPVETVVAPEDSPGTPWIMAALAAAFAAAAYARFSTRDA